MQKPLALSIAVCLSLTSCQVFEKSRTWETVMSVRPGDAFRQADPSAYYADQLHHVLLDLGVEHIVVTYQYHYYTHQYEEALGTRTAVVYRDDTDPRYPWWLKDDRLGTPFWLPNGDLNKQLSFYCRRKAEVIEQKHYSAHGASGKAVVAPVRTTQQKAQFRDSFSQLRHEGPPQKHVAERPQPITKIAQIKPAPAQSAKPVVTYHHPVSAKPAVSATAPAAITKIQHPVTVAVAKPKPAPEVTPSATHPNSFWAPPAAIDPVEQAFEPAPRDEHLEKLFRARNGTTYDPTSAVDRRKMEQLKHGLVGKETSGEHGFRRGVDGGPVGSSHF
jgi:hypothetical protein